MTIHDVIKRPIVTEKSSVLRDQVVKRLLPIDQKKDKKDKAGVKLKRESEDYTRVAYVFAVDGKADKPMIKKAVEQLFKVKVSKINTTIVPGKFKRAGTRYVKTSSWKKATVVLSEGKIEVFEGV
jgi:large subunit ribosomal protein L23